ncbi:Tctex-1 family-domain-containing protein [Geopyxis carbonaria]|nr:Tctex-1 family-domain-containing protein [Geopyxis carbonaria]
MSTTTETGSTATDGAAGKAPATASSAASKTTPVSLRRLEQICADACTLTLTPPTTYDHPRCPSWNQSIINHVLRALVSESTPAGESRPPYKFQVNSTIIQHLSGTEGGAGTGATKGGRRGMHAASGAYWNMERDGSWTYKHDTDGMDVVVTVTWIAIV